MLKFFRKKIVMKVILWGLIILVVPAFVMWGGASMDKAKNKGPAYVGLTPGNEKVSFEDLYNAEIGSRSQIIINYFNQPKVLESLLSNKPIMAKLAWDRIIMLGEAKSMGIKASDKEVIGYIRSHPLFLRNGVFDEKFYAYILRNNIALEPRSFEETVRENIILQKMTAQLTKDIKVSDEEVADAYNKELGRYSIDYILLEPKSFIDTITVDDAAVKEFFEKHRESFVAKPKIKGSEPERPATFEEAKTTVEKYMKEAEAAGTLKDKAGEFHKKLVERMKEKGETFEKAALKLGLETRKTELFSAVDKLEAIGDMRQIAAAAEEMKDAQLSEPVGTEKGFVIFIVTERGDADPEALKKDKEKYSAKARDKKINERMTTWLRELEDKAKLIVDLDEMEKYQR